MEIKIKEVYEEEGNHSFETSLFEGDGITHKKVYFKTKEEFIKKYDEESKGLEGCTVGVPEHYWFKDKSNEEPEFKEGYFIFIKFSTGDSDVTYIIVMNRIIYITNKGQTIDIIE